MSTPSSRQDYEARIGTEQERLLNLRREWTLVVRVLQRLRDLNRISPEVYNALETAAERAMAPVSRHLVALEGMAGDMRVARRQPNFSRMEDPQALVFDTQGRRNESGMVEVDERFDAEQT